MEDLIRLETGVAERPLSGGEISGDRSLVMPSKYGVLIGVIDGAGHGVDAAAAAEAAVSALSSHSLASLEESFLICHTALAKTRGAAMTLVRLERATDGTVELWGESLGVGDVAAQVVQQGKARTLVSIPGIVGYRLPRLMTTREIGLSSGDLLMLATDGVGPIDAAEVIFMDQRAKTAQEIAEFLLRKYRTGTDDALVLVARVLSKDVGEPYGAT